MTTAQTAGEGAESAEIKAFLEKMRHETEPPDISSIRPHTTSLIYIGDERIANRHCIVVSKDLHARMVKVFAGPEVGWRWIPLKDLRDVDCVLKAEGYSSKIHDRILG